jgi:hypothetical protein
LAFENHSQDIDVREVTGPGSSLLLEGIGALKATLERFLLGRASLHDL